MRFRILFCVLCLSFCTFDQPVFGQGCPAGVPSGGNPLCLPTGAPGSPYQHGDQVQQQTPQARWEDRWGAIAFDPSNAGIGVASGMTSKRKAKSAALAHCKEKGGNGCRIDLVYYNQCGVIAWGEAYATTAGAGTVERASEVGLQLCEQQTKKCRIVYSDCSLPVRVQ